jgi:type II secretory pathway pseudopilin PulG
MQIMKIGDTIIEVIFAITVFSLVAVVSISLMNQGVATAQASLELSMARNEIDSQAEAIRFIHNSYVSEREFAIGSQGYANLWQALTNESRVLKNVEEFKTGGTECSIPNGSFVVNPKSINTYANPNDVIVKKTDIDATNKIFDATVYPRIIYGANDSDTNVIDSTSMNILRVEGLWMFVVAGGTGEGGVVDDFYDFHIRACWHAPGRRVVSTIGTIIRLYNPRVYE